MTNADKIRSMTDEELAKVIANEFCDCCIHERLSEECLDRNCADGILAWLEKEEGDE